LGESGQLCYRKNVNNCMIRCNTYYSQASRVTDSGSKLSISYPLHTTLNNRHYGR
jgi:hypothetical protein